MTLTTSQIKEAKAACKANGINPALVTKEVGNGFWNQEAGGTFEGYVTWLLKSKSIDGSFALAAMRQSNANYRAGKSGMSSLTK